MQSSVNTVRVHAIPSVAGLSNVPMQTPLRNALVGFAGMFVVGMFSTAVIAVWVRARPADRM